MNRLRRLAAAAVAVLCVAPGARATVPRIGWTPASFGMLPACGKYQADGYLYNGCLITRRIRPDPVVPGRFYAGTLFNGPWVSDDGMTWAPLVAGCQSNLYTVAGADPSGLTACGVDDIAFDPLSPATIYISTYVFSNPYLTGYHIEPGGIYRSTNAGATWTKISPSIRGAALVVIHRQGEKATIIAGQIQHADHDVGNTASVLISGDDGVTWRKVRFPSPRGCLSSSPATSSLLVATLTVNPANANIVYAGSNAGLYQSLDRGRSWSLVLNSCLPGVVGSTWGVDVTRDGRTIYAGSWDGVVRMASTSSLGLGSWTPVARLSGTFITDLMIDARDGRTVFAAALDKRYGAGREAAGVYRIPPGGRVELLLDSALEFVNHETGPVWSLTPYAITKTGPAFWLAQSPVAPDVLYLSQAQSGIVWRSDGEPLPKPPPPL